MLNKSTIGTAYGLHYFAGLVFPILMVQKTDSCPVEVVLSNVNFLLSELIDN